jgi:ATP-dependent Clp protease ATP-binding subunit ClpA
MGTEPLSTAERELVAAAEQEARRLHHARLGTEHLLLGVLSRPDEPGARALAKLGVTLGPTRAQVMRIVGLPEMPSPPALTHTPMARSALGGALREAIESGETTVASEHVLLAMLRERDSLAVRILRDAGVDPRRLRDEVAAAAAAPSERKRSEPDVVDTDGAALGAHVLLGVLAAGGPAADLLRAHGVDEAAVGALLRRPS